MMLFDIISTDDLLGPLVSSSLNHFMWSLIPRPESSTSKFSRSISVSFFPIGTITFSRPAYRFCAIFSQTKVVEARKYLFLDSNLAHCFHAEDMGFCSGRGRL
jgi:hypothetical protein